MRRNTLTIVTVLGLATGPSALFTATALGDFGSPDARDANATALAKQNVDLRSPDARDSGRVVAAPAPAPSGRQESQGTPWGAIVGGAALAFAALGVAIAVSRRQRHHTAVTS